MHLIREQIEQIFNKPVYKEHQTYKNGIIHNKDILQDALRKLHYGRFTNDAEIAAAVGTNGMELSRQIANRMFERVKK